MGNGNGKNEKTSERIGILSSKKVDLRDESEKKKEELKERFLKQKNELEKKIQGYQEKKIADEKLINQEIKKFNFPIELAVKLILLSLKFIFKKVSVPPPDP